MGQHGHLTRITRQDEALAEIRGFIDKWQDVRQPPPGVAAMTRLLDDEEAV